MNHGCVMCISSEAARAGGSGQLFWLRLLGPATGGARQQQRGGQHNRSVILFNTGSCGLFSLSGSSCKFLFFAYKIGYRYGTVPVLRSSVAEPEPPGAAWSRLF